MIPPFHLAFPIRDIDAARDFYVGLLGCKVGREADRWIDFDFFGHQISAHLAPEDLDDVATNTVDGKEVPVRHFGVILGWEAWHALADRLKGARTPFLIEPGIRFEGQIGEQATMFISDPSGNGLEFKAFKDPASIFAR